MFTEKYFAFTVRNAICMQQFLSLYFNLSLQLQSKCSISCAQKSKHMTS